MINSIRSAFSVILILIYSQVAFAQIAAILPQASTQFFDSNGDPLSSGTVNFYIPNTSTPKTTWQDPDQVTQNPNTITLDAAGRALIWGVGSYRMLVKAQNGNIIYDKPTSSAGSGGGSGSAVGDGNIVGTILQWSGLIAPPNYAFAYGQELSRVDYPLLYSTITSTQAMFCTLGSPTLSGIGDTTQLPIGAAVESSCVPTGSLIVSKTTSTVTLNNNAIVSTNTTGIFFAFGNGNGVSTFNVPDLRGKFIPGRNNMGGSASSNLTQTYYGSNPDAIGASGGGQSKTLTIAQLPIVTPAGTIAPVTPNVGGFGIISAFAGSLAINVDLTGGTTAFYPTTQMGAASSLTPIFTGTPFGSNSPHSVINPSLTLNYVIKVLPDASGSTVSGVASLGGMTGVIACGTGLTCSANTISSTFALTPAGSDTQLQFNNSSSFGASANLTWVSPKLTIGLSGTTAGQLGLAGSTSGNVTQTAQAVAGTPTITWGNTSGTPAVTATAPLVLSGTTGALTLTSSGTGSACLTTSCVMVTPTLGVASATSINKVAFTAPATSATLTIADGTTLTATTSTSVGRGQYLGTSTNDAATAGNIGEYVSSTVLVGSIIALTNATPANITSISLTAGDWDVWINARYGGSATTVNRAIASISATSATLTTTPGTVGDFYGGGGAVFTLSTANANAGPVRVSLSGTTTYYFVGQCDFSGGTCGGYGIIQARRVR